MNRKAQIFTLAAVVISVLLLAACNKKVAKVVPPPPPAPTQPTAKLAANPNIIQPGQSTELTWQTTNANSIKIAGLGTVSSSGSRLVSPDSSTTFTLVAQGPGGTVQATARVTVNPLAAQLTSSPSEQELFARSIKDIFFDFDKFDVRPDQLPVTENDAGFLAQHVGLSIVIEGHCDDRGSEEYNLALGDSRANSLKLALIAQGVGADRIKTISYGKERPFCSENNESCWQQNRRDHLGREN